MERHLPSDPNPCTGIAIPDPPNPKKKRETHALQLEAPDPLKALPERLSLQTRTGLLLSHALPNITVQRHPVFDSGCRDSNDIYGSKVRGTVATIDVFSLALHVRNPFMGRVQGDPEFGTCGSEFKHISPRDLA